MGAPVRRARVRRLLLQNPSGSGLRRQCSKAANPGENMHRFGLVIGAMVFACCSATAAEPPLPTGATARLGDARFLHPATVSHVIFSTDGKQVATLGGDRLLWWNASTGEQDAEPFKNEDVKFGAARVSADN